MKMQWDLLMNGTLQKFKGEETKQKEATNSAKKKMLPLCYLFKVQLTKKSICLNCFTLLVLTTKIVIVLI